MMMMNQMKMKTNMLMTWTCLDRSLKQSSESLSGICVFVRTQPRSVLFFNPFFFPLFAHCLTFVAQSLSQYLYNLDVNSAYYDPKTRSMRENPFKNTGKDSQEWVALAAILLFGQLAIMQQRLRWFIEGTFTWLHFLSLQNSLCWR